LVKACRLVKVSRDFFAQTKYIYNTMGLFVATLNVINNILHIEPIAILVDLIFWLVIFCVGFPVAAIVTLLRGIYLFLYFFFRPRDIDPSKGKEQEEVAVLVTGCDSGFGREVVPTLTSKRFIVFAGCLHQQSLSNFKKDPLVIPIVLDVTSDKSVKDAQRKVSSWLAGGVKTKRYFHALVNNAGVGRPSMIDWAPVSDFQACIDVNYIGMVRCVKEFLPILQKQAILGTYTDARIINMVSMAGLIYHGGDGASPYVASKHAADAFTANLRLEMNAYGVHVTTINPSFHQTPMADPDAVRLGLEKTWSNLEPNLQEEYGEGAFVQQKLAIESI